MSPEKLKEELAKKVEEFELQKAEFVAMREKIERENEQRAINLHNQAEILERKSAELSRREITIEAREEAFAIAKEEFTSLAASAKEVASKQQTPAFHSAYRPSPVQSAYINTPPTRFEDLQSRANSEGIRVNTAGSLQSVNTGANAVVKREQSLFNKGFTLFKTAMVVFCLVLAECLSVFFLRDAIGVNAIYPAVPFAIGFVAFIICAILYACGYRSQERRTKSTSYMVSALIIFVITVIATSMVAIYFKADLMNAKELLKFIVIPVVFLLNIVLFAVFYRLFAKQTNAE